MATVMAAKRTERPQRRPDVGKARKAGAPPQEYIEIDIAVDVDGHQHLTLVVNPKECIREAKRVEKDRQKSDPCQCFKPRSEQILIRMDRKGEARSKWPKLIKKRKIYKHNSLLTSLKQLSMFNAWPLMGHPCFLSP